jgi:hypothetical protein
MALHKAFKVKAYVEEKKTKVADSENNYGRHKAGKKLEK